MRLAIAGPIETATFRRHLGLKLEGAPAGDRATPIGPLACGLVQRGHDVHVVTLVTDVAQPVQISEGGLTLHYLPRRRRARDLALSFFSKEIVTLADTLRAIAPDIVHAHWTYEFAEGALRSGLPHLVTMRDNPWRILWLFRDPYRFFRLLMAMRTIPRIKMLAVVSPHMILPAHLLGYFRRVTVVPNGVFVPPYIPKITDYKLDRTIRIVTVGDSGRLKNVQASIAAFIRIRQKFGDAELHLFGPGLDDIYGAGAPGIYGHGAVSHDCLMQFLFEEATLLIHPSLEEACPVILAEAMARGLPVVAGRRSGGVPYVGGPELAFMLVDVRDPRKIADKVIEVLTDRRKYQIVGQLGVDRVHTSLSQELMVDRYFSLYLNILNANEPRCKNR